MINIRGAWSKKEIPIILSVLILLVLGGWYVWHRHQRQSAEDTQALQAALVPPPGWTIYKDTADGFQFVYPKSWGPVNVSALPQQPGKTYSVNFKVTQLASAGFADTFAITMDSSDASTKYCDPKNKQQCSQTSAFTKADIEKALSADKTHFAKYDSSSFAVYDYRGYSSLQVDRIINLPQIKVTAARATFQRLSTARGCPMNKLAQTIKTGCIGLSVYNDVSRILKSLQPL